MIIILMRLPNRAFQSTKSKNVLAYLILTDNIIILCHGVARSNLPVTIQKKFLA
jgi:hypothetical protein